MNFLKHLCYIECIKKNKFYPQKIHGFTSGNYHVEGVKT